MRSDFQKPRSRIYDINNKWNHGFKNKFNLFLDIVAVQQNTAVPPAAASPATHMEQATTCQTSKKPRSGLRRRPTIPPKPQLLHYCEVCKITCAGPQVSPVPA